MSEEYWKNKLENVPENMRPKTQSLPASLGEMLPKYRDIYVTREEALKAYEELQALIDKHTPAGEGEE